MGVYTPADLEQVYQDMTGFCKVDAAFIEPVVGGAPVDEAGVRVFVEHQLHLVGEEAEQAVKRIMAEEMQQRPEDVDIEGQGEDGEPVKEVPEYHTYGVTMLRRDEEDGWPWLGNWMMKACLKAAASRLGLFVAKRGTKGDIAEMGRVQAIGPSLRRPDKPGRIYLIGADGLKPVCGYDTIKGRVTQPNGASVSIVSQREYAPAGTMFFAEFRWYDNKLTEEDVVAIWAAGCNIGLGSAKAYERGKFRCDRLEVEMAVSKRAAPGARTAAKASRTKAGKPAPAAVGA